MPTANLDTIPSLPPGSVPFEEAAELDALLYREVLKRS